MTSFNEMANHFCWNQCGILLAMLGVAHYEAVVGIELGARLLAVFSEQA
jgi:hypothetical protein